MSENNALATQNMEAGFARLAQFNGSAAAKELSGFNMRFDRIKVPSGGGTSYMLAEADINGETEFKEIKGVILFHHPMQSYFPDKYTGASIQPDCSSMDGITGVGKPGGSCGRCYLNQFGSGENNSKACKRKHRIYLLREGEIFPMILDVPTLSVDNLGKYLRRVITVGKDPGAIVTRFTLQKAVNKGGIAYSQVIFSAGRDLTPEEYTAVRALAEEVQTYSQSIGYDDDLEPITGETVFDYDQETGEIFQPAAASF